MSIIINIDKNILKHKDLPNFPYIMVTMVTTAKYTITQKSEVCKSMDIQSRVPNEHVALVSLNQKITYTTRQKQKNKKDKF